MIKILMIEDDVDFAHLLSKYLSRFDIEVTNFEDPFLALSIDLKGYDLVILDLTLPGIDGLEVCKELVKKSDIPIIISSARGDLEDKVLGLNIGADDYLPKPYDPKELYARVVSILRRYKKINSKDDKEITFNIKKDELVVNSEAISLTPAELEVFKQLYKNRYHSVSKEQILYSSDIFLNSNENSLAVIINRLRNKLKKYAKIKSIRGVGYKLII